MGNKISATLSSTGTPSFFIHATEANHGDLGMITKNDCLLILSHSGETSELKNIINYTKKNSLPLISITGNKNSMLSLASEVAIILPDAKEACPNSLIPTTSTTMQLVIGDTIAMILMELNSFSEKDFKKFHPGGRIGASLLNIDEVMHTEKSLPIISLGKSMGEAIIIMNEKRFGCVGIIDEISGQLIGIITDGDLRRSMGVNLVDTSVEKIMTKNPITLIEKDSIKNAINLLNKEKITCVFVTKDKKPIGIVHLHDLIKITST
ncbi:KpsF/GutQ family sugar-phosphate isomerase [Hyphomicrobiales bacterium]|nr:KpsF/GutQ family sugar-phosphate isomerase [Hyphomicrobiales bacterium]